MSELADRHSGTLGGRLNEIGTTAESVTVAIEAGCAERSEVQHAAWMLVNLLSRMEGVVTALELMVLHALSDALGVTIDALIEGLPVPKERKPSPKRKLGGK